MSYTNKQTLGYFKTMIDNQIMFPKSYKLGKVIPRKEAVSVYQKIAEVFFLETIMSHLNLNWHLVTHGSQDADFGKTVAFHLKMAEIADKALRRREEE